MRSSWLGRTVRIKTGSWHGIMLGKVVSGLDLWNIVLSTVVSGICFAKPDTILVFEFFYGVFGEEPALQCRRQSARRTHRH